MKSAVVFAYHDVGVRCLKVLLASGVDVKLVVTHEDNPQENIWFASVRKTAEEYAIPVITPENPNVQAVEQAVRALAPDFVFSFYYRHMLKAPLLEAARYGAFNMHGSLLPKYRGRVPVNWAIIHDERETGASLHVMNIKPDNGPLVDQQSVPILPDDTAQEVFAKVLVAAEICLLRALPDLLAGKASLHEQDLRQGAYFGGRKAEDGRINWHSSPRAVHNLVRAVTRPYPGAFADTPEGRLILWRTRVLADSGALQERTCLTAVEHALQINFCQGGVLHVLEATLDGVELRPENFMHFAGGFIRLD